MKDEASIRAARAEMDEAKAQAEKTLAGEPKQPRRYRLYDRIRDQVSLRTVDIVIAVTAALIVALLIIGIVTGKGTK